MSTLRELVESELDEQDESVEDIEAIQIGPSLLSDQEVERVDGLEELEQFEGYTGYGSQSLPAIYLWTKSRVYLKGTYDGAEWVTSVPRHPSDEAPDSVGGG